MDDQKDIRKRLSNFFASKYGIIFAGAFIGVVAAILQSQGNPGNMGFCIACFTRDTAGAIGLFSTGPKYIRPEIIGIVLGSLIAAYVFKEYRPRTGSAPMIRFILGLFAMIGALVFLGCPWRAFLRLAGGDLNAILGISGLATGIFIGSMFLRNGFNLGRSRKTYPAVGLVLPAIMVGLLVLLLVSPTFADGTSVISSGAAAAPIALSLGIALCVGFIAQRTRFCTVGGIRDAIVIKDFHLLFGVIALAVGAFVMNLILGQFNAGFTGQPAAHTDHLWNYLGMVLAGFAFVLAGGCPGRQLILSGEGNADSAVFVVGMVAGAALSHNFRLASSGAGTGEWGPAAVIAGLVICFVIAFTMRDKQ